MNCALVNSNIQLDVRSFDLKFQFKFGISNEIAKFPMNLQNSTLEIPASLNDKWHTKRLLGPYFEKLVVLEFNKFD